MPRLRPSADPRRVALPRLLGGLRGTPMSVAVRFDDMPGYALDHSLEGAPSFERFAPAAKHAIRVIHGLPTLFEGRSLGEIEVYIGRTAYDPRSLRGRWRDHAGRRRHEF